MRDFLDGAALINDFHVQQRRMAGDARNRTASSFRGREAGPFGAAYMAKQTAISDPRDGMGCLDGEGNQYTMVRRGPLLGLADHDSEIKDLSFIQPSLTSWFDFVGDWSWSL